MELSLAPGGSEPGAEETWTGDALPEDVRARFDAAYRAYRDAVLRLLRRRLGDDPDVPDLMQEAYLRILRYRNCSPESLKLLLFRTALNLAASHGLQARRRMPHVSLEGMELEADLRPLEEVLERELMIERAVRAAAQLPARCREVLLMRLLYGLKQREIAERCGISTRMVEQHLARAQVLIRERMRATAA